MVLPQASIFRFVLQLTVCLITILYGSYFAFYLYELVRFKPLYWYFITYGLAGILFLFWFPRNIQKTFNIFVLWIWCFLCFGIFNYLYSTQSATADQALIQHFHTVLLLVSFYVLISTGGTRSVQLGLILVVILGVTLNVVDFNLPTWSKTQGRAAGIYVNPSISGKSLVFAMIASIGLIPYRFRLAYCMIVGLGVLITFSRGSWLLWIIGIIGLAGIGNFSSSKRNNNLNFLLITVACVGAAYVLVSGELLNIIGDQSNLSDKLTANTITRLGGGEGVFTDNSAVSRFQVIQKALEFFAEEPWLGHGIGYSYEWSHDVPPHNMYLNMAVNGGIFGLLIYLSMLIVLWLRTNDIGKVLVVVYAASSLFTHNNLEQPATLLILVLIALLKVDTDYTSRGHGCGF